MGLMAQSILILKAFDYICVQQPMIDDESASNFSAYFSTLSRDFRLPFLWRFCCRLIESSVLRLAAIGQGQRTVLL